MPDKIKAQMANSKSKPSVSVIIYASNAEKHIERAVKSAKLLSSSILLVDIGSTDQTPAIAKRLGAEVITLEQTQYVELVRMEGIKRAKADWIFILDSDEVITADLANEIHQAIGSKLPFGLAQGGQVASFRVPRKNMFGASKWLKHGGWWPDSQIRLIKRSELANWPSTIHSTPEINGIESKLQEPLIHYSHGDFSQMVQKTVKFENAESELLSKAHKKVTTLTFFRKFLGELYRRLIKSKGYLDGNAGIAESIYQAYSKTVTYLMLYEKSR